MQLWNYTLNYWEEIAYCFGVLAIISYFTISIIVSINPIGKHAKRKKDNLKGKKE